LGELANEAAKSQENEGRFCAKTQSFFGWKKAVYLLRQICFNVIAMWVGMPCPQKRIMEEKS
jgi:hypothetical protein